MTEETVFVRPPFDNLPRDFQHDYVVRAVAVWKDRLKLNHIKLELNFEEDPEDDDAIASITPSNMYDWAMVRFSEGFWKESDWFEVNRVLVHEMMHVLARDVENVFELSVRNLSFDARGVLQNQWTHATEAMVDRLAHRFVELAGVVE